MKRLYFLPLCLGISLGGFSQWGLAEVTYDGPDVPVRMVAPWFDVINKVRDAISSPMLFEKFKTTGGISGTIDKVTIPNWGEEDNDRVWVESGSCRFQVVVEPKRSDRIGVISYKVTNVTPIFEGSCSESHAALPPLDRNSYDHRVRAFGILIDGYNDIYTTFPSSDKPKTINARKTAADRLATEFVVSSRFCSLSALVGQDQSLAVDSAPRCYFSVPMDERHLEQVP